MSTEAVPPETTTETSTTPATPSFTTTTHATSTTTTTTILTSTSTFSPTSSGLNTSSFTSTSLPSYSTTNATALPTGNQSQGDVAIICGVIFGVLGLAIALVALYIIVRKVKENKERNRKRLQYENSEQKPYDPVQKDFDSDRHSYQEVYINNKAATNTEISDSMEGNGKISEGPYANINISAQPVYFNMGVKSDDGIETYEPTANPDRQSQTYMDMNIDPVSSRQNSNADANVLATSTTASKENLSKMSSYANMKSVNAENSSKKTEHSDYANTPLSLPNGQNRLSLNTEDPTKPKKHKSSKKKNTYDINSGSVANLDDITYKL